MSVDTIPVLKDSYRLALRREASTREATALYKTADTFSLDPEGIFHETHVCSATEKPELAVPVNGNRAAKDADNAILVYEYLPGLTPIMASDKRLWVYLTHGPFFNYCQRRFPFSGSGDNVNNIIDHWFFGKGKLRRNAISRLWWAAHLTCAPWKQVPGLDRFERDDDYYYTRFILKNQQIYQDIIERDFGSSVQVRIAALDVLDKFESRTSNLTKLAARFTKDLNLVASHTDMGAADVEVLHTSMFELAERIVS